VRIYLMTDQEGVAGVVDWDWADVHEEQAKRLLTLEVNAAVEGFFAAGATAILVVDGHGRGGIDPELLDERVEYLRGWGKPRPWPLHLDEGFDFVAWVGQHAKAGTEYGHLTHTQGLRYVDLAINGVSIGEFGQLALCAGELGIRAIFGAGDLAFTREAAALAPGIETVWVKRGLSPGRGDELDEDAYRRKNRGAIHLAPAEARRRIRAGAERALCRAATEGFGLVSLAPPYERVARFRPNRDHPYPTVSRETHPSSVIEVMNLPFEPVAAPRVLT
jgi:D-amino peptidase